MNSTNNTSTTPWKNWAAVLKTELKCTRTRAHLIERELFQHYSEVVNDRADPVNPVDILGEPRQLAADFNENFWAGYAVRQLILLPVTAALTLFIGFAVSRGVIAYGTENWFSTGKPTPLMSSENLSAATALNSEQLTVSSWFLSPSPFGAAKTRGTVDERFFVDCTIYVGCNNGERWLLISRRLEKQQMPDIGFQIQHSRAIVSALDDTGRLLRSEGIDRRYAENSASLVRLVLQDLLPWILGAFALRLGLLLIFESFALATLLGSAVRRGRPAGADRFKLLFLFRI